MVRVSFINIIFLIPAFVKAQAPTDASASLPTVASPKPSGDLKAMYRLYGFHGCSGDEERGILDALGEKDILTSIDSTFQIKWSHALAVDYLGPPVMWKSNRDRIQANFRSLHVFGNGWWFHSKNTQIFCHDRSLEGEWKDDCAKYPGHIITVNRYADNHDAMMFCDSWFQQRTLADGLKRGLEHYDNYDVSQYENRAIHLIAALCMKTDICRWPSRNGGERFIHHMVHTFNAYGSQFASTPSAIKWVAKERGTLNPLEVVGNADMYGWFAMAGYVMENRQLGHYPNKPLIPRDIEFPDVQPSSAIISDQKQMLSGQKFESINSINRGGCNISPECYESSDDPKCGCECNGRKVGEDSRCTSFDSHVFEKKLSKAVSIWMTGDTSNPDSPKSWQFFVIPYNKKATGCGKPTFEMPITTNNTGQVSGGSVHSPSFSKGKWTMTLNMEKCTYESDVDAGNLTCAEMAYPIKCKEHPGRKVRQESATCVDPNNGGDYISHQVAFCEW